MSGLCAWLRRAPDAAPVLLGLPGELTGRGGSPASVSYAQLKAALAGAAAQLANAGATGRDPLAIAAATRGECVLLVLLAAWQGRPALPLPVNALASADTGLPDGPGLLCGSAAHRIAAAPGWERVEVDWPGAFARPGGPPAAADGPGWIVQTSGTAGPPRRVVLESRSISASVAASSAVLRLSPGDRWLLCLPPDRIGGLMVIARALACAGAVAVTDGFDAEAVARSVAENRVGHLSVVPAMLDPLLDAGTAASLRTLLVGGASLDPSLAERLRAGSWPAWVSYGMTETCSHVALATVNETWRPGLVGAPVPGASIDFHEGHPGPARITIRGPMVMRGYLGERPLQGPLVTGDVGWMDSAGRLHVSGRADDVIVTGGTNVHPARIEAVLAGMPGVASAAVGSIPDPRWGRRLAALYVGAARPESLAEACRRQLSAAERPRAFTRVAELPFNGSGKLDRRKVDELLAGGGQSGPAEG